MFPPPRSLLRLDCMSWRQAPPKRLVFAAPKWSQMLLEPGPQRYEDLIPESDSRIGSAMTARAFAHSSKWFLPATVQRHFSVRWLAESEEKIRKEKTSSTSRPLESRR